MVSVKLGVSPASVRSWGARDLFLVFNTIRFLNEVEARELEKTRKENELRKHGNRV